MKLQHLMGGAAILALGLFSRATYGQELGGGRDGGLAGITVIGSAEIKQRPDSVEIEVSIRGTGDTTDKALVEYHDAKQHLLDGLNALKLKNLKVDEPTLRVGPDAGDEVVEAAVAPDGTPIPTLPKPRAQFEGIFKLHLSDIKGLTNEQIGAMVGKALDAAQEAGAKVGSGSTEIGASPDDVQTTDGSYVHFVLADLADVREKAYREAVADAHVRADRLAKLLGGQVGPAIGVQEIEVSGDRTPATLHVPAGRAGGTLQPTPYMSPGTGGQARVTADVVGDVPFQVRLQVRYALEPVTTGEAPPKK